MRADETAPRETRAKNIQRTVIALQEDEETIVVVHFDSAL
jgi:hypothetical protein